MTSSVFRALLGDELDSVNGQLRDFSDSPLKAQGNLTVVHHTGRTARFFIWILGLPKEGERQAVSISISSKNGREYWQRQIGDAKLRTRHAVVRDWLEERAGKFRFLHIVSVSEGGLKYRQDRVYFLGIRLPLLFSPIIDADARGDETGWDLEVIVSCPRCGPICQYKGRISIA